MQYTTGTVLEPSVIMCVAYSWYPLGVEPMSFASKNVQVLISCGHVNLEVFTVKSQRYHHDLIILANVSLLGKLPAAAI